MSKKTYKVVYLADDGTIQGFKFKTDRSMARVYRNDGISIPMPFLCDLCAAADRIAKRSDSGIAKHGFLWVNIKRIQCVETGAVRAFA